MQAEDAQQPGRARQAEPWPWILASLLLAMMTISVGFAWIAATYPDPVVVDERYEAHGDSFAPRLEKGGVSR